jgi:hypothetical protein
MALGLILAEMVRQLSVKNGEDVLMIHLHVTLVLWDGSYRVV